MEHGNTGNLYALKHGGCTGRKVTSEYNCWSMMRQRCNNQFGKDFARYGGRGIKMCERWKTFDLFFQDMGFRPTPLHTIERINNDLGYSPDNCKWATRAEQARNRTKVYRTRSVKALTV